MFYSARADFAAELFTFYFQRISMRQLSKQPSFVEFVDWLISERLGKDSSRVSWNNDKTWVPYHNICPVCQYNFTILKLDSGM